MVPRRRVRAIAGHRGGLRAGGHDSESQEHLVILATVLRPTCMWAKSGEQLSPKEREGAAALRTHFGEEKFASAGRALRAAPPSALTHIRVLHDLPRRPDRPFPRGYAEETSWQGPCFVQQLLADSLAWRARVGAHSTGQLSSCARPCPALACLAVRAPRPPPPDNGGHRLPRPLGAPSTPPRPTLCPS